MSGEQRLVGGLGVTHDELVRNGAWAGPGGNPTWVIGEGHVTLEEGRRRLIDELVDAEAAVEELKAALREAVAQRTIAIRRHGEAETRLRDGRIRLASTQRAIAHACNFEAVEPPGPIGE